MFHTSLETPFRSQFETSSGTLTASAKTNCGPASVAKIVEYMTDRSFGIEETRRLVMGCCTVTGFEQCRQMMARRGVPAGVYFVTGLAGLRQVVGNGTRPAMIVIDMSRVKLEVAGHSFRGNHWLVVMAAAQGGFWIMDPNFSPPGGVRPDPTGGKRWYSNPALQHAWADTGKTWIVAPANAKRLPVPADVPAAASGSGPLSDQRAISILIGLGAPVAWLSGAKRLRYPMNSREELSAWAQRAARNAGRVLRPALQVMVNAGVNLRAGAGPQHPVRASTGAAAQFWSPHPHVVIGKVHQQGVVRSDRWRPVVHTDRHVTSFVWEPLTRLV